jgi:exodeoxyribonuclease VII small subunit
MTASSAPALNPSSASVGSTSFESALAELEAIVERMESGELSLEASLAAHKRGLELARHCQGILAQAQQQVRVLEDETLKALPGAEPDL